MANYFEDIKRIVVDRLQVDEKQVTMEAGFIDDLGADSLDTVELVMALEENFGIEITPWKEVLGWIVDADTLLIYSKEVFTAAVLWEITWFGYDETIIQKKVESWNSQHDSDKSEGDEDIL